MIIILKSCVVQGLDVRHIDIEVDVSRGHPSFNIVGLPDTAIREAIERIRLAIRNSGMKFPFEKRIVINLAPASLKKSGACFDVSMALGIIMASQGKTYDVSNTLFFGELSLDGKIKPVTGLLPQVLYAQKTGIKKIYLPYENCYEAGLVDNITLLPVQTLEELLSALLGKTIIKPYISGVHEDDKKFDFQYDMKYVHGNKQAKRALEIAAAGGHHCMLIGSPGSGKTLLSQTFPSILPILSHNEMIEVSKIYSIAGLFHQCQNHLYKRVIRNPHHSVTRSSFLGGGRVPRPGEISLAHRGVLFLDEFLEFPLSVLEALRQPLEEGDITINRVNGSYKFPANFQLLAACNPCPCGFYLDEKKECICTQQQILRYQRRLSGPILDRIDLFVNVFTHDLSKQDKKNDFIENSQDIRKRVERASEIQKQRFLESSLFHNKDMNYKNILKYCKLDHEAQSFFDQSIKNLYLSNRGYLKVLKVARTIADLDQSDTIQIHHIAESLQYRQNIEFISS